MKITAVEPFHIGVPYDFGNTAANAAAAQWPKMETLFVKVTIDDGVVGWGEGFGLAACGITKVAVEKAIAPLAVGRDPTDIAALMREIAYRQRNCSRNGPVGFALSALDIALWDIAGKRAGKPLYRLLGATETIELMPAYASLLRYGNADVVRTNSAAAVARGYRSVKLHETGAAEISAARETIGADITLTVDASCAWTVPQAIAMAKELQPCNLTWLEEPLWPPEDYAGMARLKVEGGIPTAAGENAGTLADIAALIATAGVDYVQPSITKIGGVSAMRQIAEMARRTGTKIAPHSPYFGPGLIATIHFAASLPEQPVIERFYLDLEASPLGSLVEAPGGFMRVPDGPGLGIAVDETVLQKYRAS
ncbi:MAG: mandelate racemase/muconate lactonizing enzyme family protein [Xanthobacteraceae bacterium]